MKQTTGSFVVSGLFLLSGFTWTVVGVSGFNGTLAAQSPLPELTAPVNDFGHVIDRESADRIDQLSRALKAVSGDVVVVATPVLEAAQRYLDPRGEVLTVVGPAPAVAAAT